jgi:hypothetical protein
MKAARPSFPDLYSPCTCLCIRCMRPYTRALLIDTASLSTCRDREARPTVNAWLIQLDPTAANLPPRCTAVRTLASSCAMPMHAAIFTAFMCKAIHCSMACKDLHKSSWPPSNATRHFSIRSCDRQSHLSGATTRKRRNANHLSRQCHTNG